MLVTDRDEVIAEIRMPSAPNITRSSPWVAFLEGQARRGALHLARFKRSRVTAPLKAIAAVDVQETLKQAREDRD